MYVHQLKARSMIISRHKLLEMRLGTKTKARTRYHLLVELNHHLDEFLLLTFRLGLRHPFPSQVRQKGGSVHLQRELSLSTEATEEQNNQWSTINQVIQTTRQLDIHYLRQPRNTTGPH